jgi:hypothetical protein
VGVALRLLLLNTLCSLFFSSSFFLLIVVDIEIAIESENAKWEDRRETRERRKNFRADYVVSFAHFLFLLSLFPSSLCVCVCVCIKRRLFYLLDDSSRLLSRSISFSF